MTRPLGFKPSPPGRIDALNFCIQAYHWPPSTCISSGDGRDSGAVEWRKMNRNFGMMELQTVFIGVGRGLSPALCEYNEQAATFRTPARGKKSTRPMQFAQHAFPGRGFAGRISSADRLADLTIGASCIILMTVDLFRRAVKKARRTS